MHAKHISDLLERFPDAFAVPAQSLECGDGWYSILETLCSCLSNLNQGETQQPVLLHNFKEKFGKLRISVHSSNPEVRAWIDFAESLSTRTCEICGMRGRLIFLDGWQRVRCPDHFYIPSYEC